MRIQVAEITYRLLQDSPNMNFELEKRMENGVAGVEVKGKGHLITYWYVSLIYTLSFVAFSTSLFAKPGSLIYRFRFFCRMNGASARGSNAQKVIEA